MLGKTLLRRGGRRHAHPALHRPAGGERLPRAAYPESPAPLLRPGHLPPHPDGGRHPPERPACPDGGPPPYRGRALRPLLGPAPGPGAAPALRHAPPHRLGGRAPPRRQQARRHGGHGLQLLPGDPHRGRGPGLPAEGERHLSRGEPAGQGHHRPHGGGKERLYPQSPPPEPPHRRLPAGVPGHLPRLPGAEKRPHRPPHRPGRALHRQADDPPGRSPLPLPL